MQDFDDDMARFHALCDAKRVNEAQALVRDLAARANDVSTVAQLGIALSRIGYFEEAERALDTVWPWLSEAERYGNRVGQEWATVKFHRGKIAEALAFEKVKYGRHWYQLPGSSGEVKYDAVNRSVRERLLTDDDSVSGKSVLLMLSGGVGDAIEQIRYAEHLMAEGARVVYANLHEPLCDLIAHSALPLTFEYANTRHLDRYDVLAIAHLLRYRYPRAGVNVPARPHYLRPVDARAPALAIAAAPGKRKVGLVWRSTNATWQTCRHEPFRSMDLVELEPLLTNPAVQFYSLHFGAYTPEEAALLARYGVADPAREIHSFADLAAVMMQLDGVITIDSAPAHLAGALGVPVWTLLAAVSDWRWNDSGGPRGPLYPSMSVFRQVTLGDWAPVVASIAAQLREQAPA